MTKSNYIRPAAISMPCQQCGVMMPPATPSRQKKFCSIQCVGKSQRKHPKWTCLHCGESFQRRPGGFEVRAGKEPMYCGRACYRVALSLQMKGRRIEPGPEAIARREERARLKQESIERQKEQKERDRQSKRRQREQDRKDRLAKERSKRECHACGGLLGLKPFTSRCCSERCHSDLRRRSRRRGKAAYRARLKGATVERFIDVEIFRRDGWRCMLCGKNTPERLMGTNHNDAPTLDHIVALANGGDHSRANTQCACRICNSTKSDGPPRGQARLF